jgi:hypothetical protein
MGEISLDMIWKRLEELHGEVVAVRQEQARTNESVAAIARTLVSVQRDIRSIQRDISGLKDRVTVLTIAVDDHPPAHV